MFVQSFLGLLVQLGNICLQAVSVSLPFVQFALHSLASGFVGQLIVAEQTSEDAQQLNTIEVSVLGNEFQQYAVANCGLFVVLGDGQQLHELVDELGELNGLRSVQAQLAQRADCVVNNRAKFYCMQR
jgi:hypothetical protein